MTFSGTNNGTNFHRGVFENCKNFYKPKISFRIVSEKLTFEQLKTHLWHAADILDEKGNIDPNEFRKPILGMLFLKRLNDVFEDNAKKD